MTVEGTVVVGDAFSIPQLGAIVAMTLTVDVCLI
jgi:hypothetical protein